MEQLCGGVLRNGDASPFGNMASPELAVSPQAAPPVSHPLNVRDFPKVVKQISVYEALRLESGDNANVNWLVKGTAKLAQEERANGLSMEDADGNAGEVLSQRKRSLEKDLQWAKKLYD
ncbi:hypothetical protein HPB50_005699 [Hyalomma asiaticum]|uniref:Uncharacterized protein n=1 Tax=Hyalomma asiaticum TaxID=266040 RepID=A0ACB7T3M1_HYAAI|nr:hypothetical protein HPB50_005699 [Hyalomma asiaticum]